MLLVLAQASGMEADARERRGEMKLCLVKFEERKQWGILNSTMETMLPFTFHDHLHGLLWLAFVELEKIGYDSKMQEHYHRLVLRWLDAVAPHYRRPAGKFENGLRFSSLTGDRILPDAWAAGIVDTADWDQESLARPRELVEVELIADLETGRRGVAEFLLEQFGEWEPAKPAGAAGQR